MTDLLDRWESAEDHRCIFVRCYLDETRSVQRGIEQGLFSNPTWLQELLINFAQFYFDALEAYERDPRSAPPAWQACFDLARAQTTTVMENLILGMNAHINRDLPLITYQMLRVRWPHMDPDYRARIAADFEAVNRTIVDVTAFVEQDVIERYSHFIQTACGICRPILPAFAWEADTIIAHWRAQAWDLAVRLLEAPSPAARTSLIEQIERAALVRIHLLLLNASARDHLLLPLERLHHLPAWSPEQNRPCHEHVRPA